MYKRLCEVRKVKYFNESLYDIVKFYDYLTFKGFIKENITEDRKKKLVKKIMSAADICCINENKSFFSECKFSYDEMMRFFEDKLAEYERLKGERDKENYETAEKIGGELKEALRAIEEKNDFVISENGNDLEFVFLNNSAMFGSVIFHDAYCENIVNIFERPLWTELSEYGDKFCFEMLTYDYYEDEQIKTKIIFKGCKVKTQIFNATDTIDFADPWGYLKSTAFSIKEKEMYAPKYLNAAEREIMPLINALVALPYPRQVRRSDTADYEALEPIAGLAEALLVYGDVAKLISKKKINCIVLSDKKYECLWRVIYSKISDTQKEYGVSSEVLYGKEEAEKKREKITKFIKKAGFSGKYPDFYRDGEITKPKQISSYGMDYTVAFEKNCRFSIKCIEQGDSIKFICGYISLGKHPQQWSDGFSVMFNDKGKRSFECITYSIEDEDLKEFINMPSLDECLRVVVKTANLQKLDKEEKRRFLSSGMSTKEKMIFFVIMAVFSGALFSLGMGCFALVEEWIISGSFQQAWTHMKDFPWLLTFFGFGVPTSAILAFITK